MKTENEIKKQLEEAYEHRLQLRIERKTKKTCRNCKNSCSRDFDLGDFGTMTKWECKNGKTCGANCGFVCMHSTKDIEDEMLADLSDSSVCGAKEPKIATLLWVLKNGEGGAGNDDEGDSDKSFWSKIKDIF